MTQCMKTIRAGRKIRMSNFNCEYCGAICSDSDYGYITGCEHYPPDIKLVCTCYPNHCEHGVACWCNPTVEVFKNGNKVIIHNDKN